LDGLAGHPIIIVIIILVEVAYIAAFKRYCSGKMKENVKGGGIAVIYESVTLASVLQ
jgi:hypothetical protein